MFKVTKTSNKLSQRHRCRVSSIQSKSNSNHNRPQLLQNNLNNRRCLYVYISLYLIEERSHNLSYTIAFTDQVWSKNTEQLPYKNNKAETKNNREQWQKRNKIRATPSIRPIESGPKLPAKSPSRAHLKDYPCTQKIRPLCRETVTQGK